MSEIKNSLTEDTKTLVRYYESCTTKVHYNMCIKMEELFYLNYREEKLYPYYYDQIRLAEWEAFNRTHVY